MTKALTPAQELARLRRQKADQMARYRKNRRGFHFTQEEIDLLEVALVQLVKAGVKVDPVRLASIRKRLAGEA